MNYNGKKQSSACINSISEKLSQTTHPDTQDRLQQFLLELSLHHSPNNQTCMPDKKPRKNPYLAKLSRTSPTTSFKLRSKASQWNLNSWRYWSIIVSCMKKGNYCHRPSQFFKTYNGQISPISPYLHNVEVLNLKTCTNEDKGRQ